VRVCVCVRVCVFRERLPTFMSRWTVLAARATAAPALVAGAVAGAGAVVVAAARVRAKA